MGIITDVNKVEIGKELKAYYENSLPMVAQLSENLSKLIARYDSMKLNTVDYTTKDCTEVKELIDDLTAKVNTII